MLSCPRELLYVNFISKLKQKAVEIEETRCKSFASLFKGCGVHGGAGVRWTPLPKAEAPTEPAGETQRPWSLAKAMDFRNIYIHFYPFCSEKKGFSCEITNIFFIYLLNL